MGAVKTSLNPTHVARQVIDFLTANGWVGSIREPLINGEPAGPMYRVGQFKRDRTYFRMFYDARNLAIIPGAGVGWWAILGESHSREDLQALSLGRTEEEKQAAIDRMIEDREQKVSAMEEKLRAHFPDLENVCII